ncbi:hypothetical protein JCM39194_16700 [Desulfotomaculum varum]
MQRLPEQDIYIYQTPGEEVHKILVGDMDGKRLKALAKVLTDSGLIVYKILAEDAQRKVETLAAGQGSPEDFMQEVNRLGKQYLEPLGESWREVQPKIIARLDACRHCLKTP